MKSLSHVRLFATSWPRLLRPLNFPGKSTGVGGHFLLHRIFPTQGSNLGLPHCGQMRYQLNHQGSHLKGSESRLTAEEPESTTSAGWSRPLRRDRACCGLRNAARRNPGRRVSGGLLERILGTEEELWGQAEEI